ncbi:YndJ family protein [Sporosarcina sp. Marseille-Q4063]|uniref:YndJ family protein n=1 Tax=Sporosarcina sp. Marseille-Q4063 TaxID=2810514 RepID=UPI0020169CB8|nr:YndJ family protein [Sporosarcina sp. Marseille-Q4063]
MPMKMRNFALIHSLLVIILMIVGTTQWPFLLLTVAQLVYVPIALRLVMVPGDWLSRYYYFFAIPAYVSVVLLQITVSNWDGLLAGVYLIFTVTIAFYGLSRFFTRGFTNIEEFAIDCGLMYLALGGGWYFAYIAGIDTGFTPLITWLTGIHFHYSAFLLPIFVGFLGRLYKTTFYKVICAVIIASPMVVAIGITFSRWIELLSVILYMVGLYGLLYLTWKTPFVSRIQKWFIRISFAALGLTIIFSLFYALGNGFGIISVSIDFMLRFHGLLNCVLFAMIGLIGWALSVPKTTFSPPIFPVSQIRGKFLYDGYSDDISGLVDDMKVFEMDSNTLSPKIVDFYENTVDYRLFASVKWHDWFMPFAIVYKLISRKMEQINLPLHRREVEMTGMIHSVDGKLDGRERVRAWIRNVNHETAFVALYSIHENEGRTYMNIALPLPFSAMIGALDLIQHGSDLQLTSKKLNSPTSDAGIYLAIKKRLLKLPIEEDFFVRETEDGSLIANHKMWIFSIPFLTINYSIRHSSIGRPF